MTRILFIHENSKRVINTCSKTTGTEIKKSVCEEDLLRPIQEHKGLLKKYIS